MPESSGTGLPPSVKRWLPLGVIGLLTVAAGLFLPQTLPSAPAPRPLTPAAASAGKGDLAYTPPALPDAPDAKAMLTRLGIGTAIVLGLCVVVLWMGRRWLTPGTAGAAGPNQMRLLETLTLSHRCCVHLVHVANRPVLVGTDGTGLKLLVPLADSFEQTLTAAHAADLAPAPPPAPGLYPAGFVLHQDGADASLRVG